MADNIVGFKFADATSWCTSEEVHSSQGDEVKIGGFTEAQQIGVLYQFENIEAQGCVANQPPSSESAQSEAQVCVANQPPSSESVQSEGVSEWIPERVLLLVKTYEEQLEMFSNSAIKTLEELNDL